MEEEDLRRWSVFEPIPKVVLSSSGIGPKGVLFHEIESPRYSSFGSGAIGDTISLSWTLGPLQVRYGHEKYFHEVVRRPWVFLPEDGLTGECQGVETSLVLFPTVRFAEDVLGEHRLGRPKLKEEQLTKLEHYLQMLRLDVRAKCPTGPTAMEFLVSAALSTIFPDSERTRSLERSINSSRLKIMYEYVDANLGSSLSLSQIAEQGGVSVRHMSRSFKAVTGFSPYEFVLRRRIDRAIYLIREGQLSFSEIALSVGFSSHAHMALAFRRILDQTPSHFRNT